MRFCLTLTLALLAGVACADETVPEPIPAVAPTIVFPVLPTPDVLPVAPTPPADPDAVPTLSYGQIYVVQSDANFALRASPKHLVDITYAPGPITVRGIFADGSGKVETRTFKSKYVAFVDAKDKASGRVELTAIPFGFTDESAITDQLIDIGAGPRPPPDPGPAPIDPVVPPPPAPTGFRVMFIYETTDKLTREQLNILHSTQITAYLNEKCVKGADGRAEWRKWDKDVSISPKESPTMVELWNSVKPKLGKLPQLVIAVNGAATVMDVPATEAETLAKIKAKAEGK